jgi:hypothetical protein
MHLLIYNETMKRHIRKDIPTAKIKIKGQNSTQEKALPLPKLKVRNKKASSKRHFRYL